MKIAIRVTPHSKVDGIVKQDDIYLVKVKAAAKEGKANEAAIKLLADYFKVPKSAVTIKTGLTGRNKIVLIEES